MPSKNSKQATTRRSKSQNPNPTCKNNQRSHRYPNSVIKRATVVTPETMESDMRSDDLYSPPTHDSYDNEFNRPIDCYPQPYPDAHPYPKCYTPEPFFMAYPHPGHISPEPFNMGYPHPDHFSPEPFHIEYPHPDHFPIPDLYHMPFPPANPFQDHPVWHEPTYLRQLDYVDGVEVGGCHFYRKDTYPLMIYEYLRVLGWD